MIFLFLNLLEINECKQVQVVPVDIPVNTVEIENNVANNIENENNAPNNIQNENDIPDNIENENNVNDNTQNENNLNQNIIEPEQVDNPRYNLRNRRNLQPPDRGDVVNDFIFDFEHIEDLFIADFDEPSDYKQAINSEKSQAW